MHPCVHACLKPPRRIQAERQHLESCIAEATSRLQTARDQHRGLRSAHGDLKQRLHEVTANLADMLCHRTNTCAPLPPPKRNPYTTNALSTLPIDVHPSPHGHADAAPAARAANLPPRVHGYFASRSTHSIAFEEYRHYETISAEAVMAADPHATFDDPSATLPQAATRFMAARAAALQQDPDQICWWLQGPHVVGPGGAALSFSVSVASAECLASMFLYFFVHALEGCFLLEAKSILEGAATPCAPPPPLGATEAPTSELNSMFHA